ncbi:helix-turn-helix domain-containing protein [Anaerosacchariphilus polymeriproducens]|uniref:AraC family transcriptional regulator n=1 Tax=Anaerosacchariphilus polymeriproducens TaxID=1812858 RepID=A0A371ASF8_9FIRM|nr:AraC family transcriptional regulator [Anaerosacchariphilus polymeriproducens]RDU22479.1 AraC family transcriptional regulator [Anaerosacchariphilus polymeriproducens]
MEEIRKVCYDNQLKIEAYQFQGIMQKFPNHFHDYYVIGFVEHGKRSLSCKNKDYIVETGDLILFNPRDNHSCEQIDQRALDYRCLNIKEDIMFELLESFIGMRVLPNFSEAVIFHSELIAQLRDMHEMIMQKNNSFLKEELFLFLIEQIISKYAKMKPAQVNMNEKHVKKVVEYVDMHYQEPITLGDLCAAADINKYALLRAFTKIKGITPYQYLQSIRINKAKKLLEQGMLPIDAAMKTGFSDQSHFSNFFKRFIGLTPGQYRNIFKE